MTCKMWRIVCKKEELDRKEKKMNDKVLKVLELHAALPYNFMKLFNRRSKNFVNREMKVACVSAEKYTDYYVTYRLRSKKMEDIPILQHPVYKEEEKIAIVLQGPLLLTDDFTLRTAEYYIKCYPKAMVIVSTWENSDFEAIKNLRECGAIVVLSKMPRNCGNLNINYQATNTLAGVKKARELGAEFICKTRTDQRIYHTDAMMFFANLVKTFPVNNTDFKREQKGRIVAMCMPYGDMFYPYCLADFLYFGYAEDIEQLFSLPLDERPKGVIGKGKSRRQIAEEMIAPEIQFMREYIARMGGNNECTVKAYWKFVKNHLITLNKDEIGVFWPKYEGRYSENKQNGSYYLNEEKNAYHCYNFDFVRWLSLYQGTLVYDRKYENYMEFIL